ncbi:MAG: hypothetical protein Q9179_004210 [Wetmoreana sp. 5 TL-2023]
MDECSAVSSQSKDLNSTADDSDLTPRPLRVNKRKRQDTEHSNRIRVFRHSSNPCTLSRNVSSRPGHDHALASLNVRKLRKRPHSHTTHVDLAVGSGVPAVTTRRGATMSYPPTFMKAWSTARHNEDYDSTRATRAVTLPTLRHDVSLHQAAQLHQSASSSLDNCPMPLDDALPSDEHQLKHGSTSDTDRTIPREVSLRHRILSRVMSSLIGRPSGTHLPAESNNSRRESIEAAPNDRDINRRSKTGRASISSVDTSSSVYTSLETALSEFPEPPVSNLTSPTTFSSFERPPSNAHGYRMLRAPSDITVVRPEISIIPEVDQLDSNDNQNIFVAVEVRAAAGLTTKLQHDRACGLDVITIIDNSLFASPATLMASCETARFLSSLLDPSNDRMAIISTSSLSTEHPDLRTIMPLTSANPRRTKTAVDRIVSSAEKPDLSALSEAVKSARALLEQSTPRDQNSEFGPLAFGHIFVLTPHSNGISPELLSHNTLQLHLINTGSVPWKGEAKVSCNGWKMQTMHSRELQSVSYNKDEDPSSLFNRLRATVVDARKGFSNGAVSDLVLDIKPGQNCAIEGVIGRRKIPTLQPGERVVALCRLKVGLSPAAGYTLTPRRQRDGSPPPCDDPDKELDKLLGTTPATVLTAKLKYKHSLLPSDTECTLSTKCQMKRRLCSPEWTDVPSKPVSIKQNNAQAEVQKRFAFHIATHHAPQQAMMVLIEDFGDWGRRSACPDYIKLLLEELKYQARTIERFDLSQYRYGPVAPTHRELRPDAYGQVHFGQGLFDASNYKPREWITDVPDEVTVQLPVSPSSKSRVLNHSQLGDTSDEARRMWIDLQKRTKSQRRIAQESGCENRGSASTELDEATRMLKELALKNKRSLGTETLKCLAYPQYRGKAVESYAPWL